MAFTVKVKDSVSYADMTTESNAIAYRAVWQMNQPATVDVMLNDVNFASTQTYGDAYIGTSALLLEEPTNTEIFRGRIIGATTTPDGQLLLRGEDWLGQLDDRLINYDTRELLDYNGSDVLRQSKIYPYLNSGTRTNALVQAAGTTNMYLDYGSNDMTIWGADKFNGMKFCLPVSTLGKQTDYVLPYNHHVTGFDVQATDNGDESDLWVNDTNCHTVSYTDGGGAAYYRIGYAFKSHTAASTAGDNIESIKMHISYEHGEASMHTEVGLDINGLNGLSFQMLMPLLEGGDDERLDVTYEWPAWAIDAVHDTSDWAVEFWNPLNATSPATIKIYYLMLEFTYSNDVSYPTQYTIDDTTTNAGSTYNQLTFTGETLVTDHVIDYMDFFICDKISTHVAALVAAYDELYALDASSDVTASTTYVGRHYHMTSPLAILQDLAKADGTDFWLNAWDGDSLDLVWNNTYAVDEFTPNWTDSTVLYWVQPSRDLNDVTNEWFVEGYTYDGNKASDSDTDAGSITSYGQRSKYKNNPDLPTSKECDIEAGVLVDRTKDLPYHVAGVMNGWNTTTVGTVIEIDSTDLSLTDKYYIITRKEYDSRKGVTFFNLTPRDATNYTLNPQRGLHNTFASIDARISALETGGERGTRYTQEWA